MIQSINQRNNCQLQHHVSIFCNFTIQCMYFENSSRIISASCKAKITRNYGNYILSSVAILHQHVHTELQFSNSIGLIQKLFIISFDLLFLKSSNFFSDSYNDIRHFK